MCAPAARPRSSTALRWLLAEGVLIAAGLRDSREVQLRLPAELNGHEAALLNAVDAIRSLAHVTTPRMQLEVQRDSHPGPWAEGPPADASRLIHTPETWCRIALLFAGASGLDASLLTLRRGIKQRGLVELAHTQSLRRQIDAWGGGVEVEGQDPVLVFDDGLGGFLPLSEADVSCRPLSLASAGIDPVPSTLMVMAEGACVLRQTRRALYRHWQLADNAEGDPVRPLLARAGAPGGRDHARPRRRRPSRALDEVALELARRGWRPPGRWAARCATTASSGNVTSGASPARRGCASSTRPRRATARVRPTSTSRASSLTSAMATTGRPSRSSGATTRCR